MVPVLSLFLFLILIRFTWLNSCSTSALQCRTVKSPSTCPLSFGYLAFPMSYILHSHHYYPVLAYVISVYIRQTQICFKQKCFLSIYYPFHPLTAVTEISLPVLQLDPGYPCFCISSGQSLRKVSTAWINQRHLIHAAHLSPKH